MIEAKVILDSRAPNGARLTTFELTYPRFIHSELMTHRVFSRNAASSRAVPTKKKIERIRAGMAKPSEWGANQKGMQSSGGVEPDVAERADALWVGLGEEACKVASILDEMGLHKQVANRLIEPWDHITTVVSTTKMNNHWKLRLEVDPETGRPMADPTYFELATKWKAAFDASKPEYLRVGDWHLPYVDRGVDVAAALDYLQKHSPDSSGDRIIEVLKKVSVGRVARTSYMRQGQGDIADNIALHDRLAKAGHWSPFEAVATPLDVEFHNGGSIPFACPCGRIGTRGAYCGDLNVMLRRPLLCGKCAMGHVTSGNFIGWRQYRKEFADEAGGD